MLVKSKSQLKWEWILDLDSSNGQKHNFSANVASLQLDLCKKATVCSEVLSINWLQNQTIKLLNCQHICTVNFSYICQHSISTTSLCAVMWSLCVSAGKMLKMPNNTTCGTTLLNMQSSVLGMRERRGKWVAQLQYVCSVFVISIECTSGTQWTPGLRPLVDSLSPRIHFQVCTWFMLHINSECSRVNWTPHRLLVAKGLWPVPQTLLRGASESLTCIWMSCCLLNALSL